MNEPKSIVWLQKYEDVRFPIRITEQRNSVLVAPHLHERCVEFLMITHGSARAQIGTEHLLMQKGDIVFVPQHSLHAVYAIEENTRLLGLCYDDSLLENPYGSILPFLLQNLCKSCVSFYPNDCAFSSSASELILNCYKNYKSRSLGFEWAMYSDVYRLSHSLLCDLAQRNNLQLSDLTRGLQRILPILEAIERRYAEPLTVAGLSSEFGLSAGHFTRIFRSIMMQTPIKYINELRVRRSLQYLCERALSIAQISERVGFASQSYYNRVFYSVMGISPIQYQKGENLSLRTHPRPQRKSTE